MGHIVGDGPRVLVYAGPTISADEVHAVLPRAEVRPPAARGDLLAEHWRPGDTAVVIDGYFRERRSVGHKEILYLLSEGVDVVGAASMGALRAAELAACGMRGLGTVYDLYASGQIDGDDEVGVLHGPAEMRYPAQTVALVNLRYGVAEGAKSGLIPAATGERIVAAAKALPFAFRSWPDIAALLAATAREHRSERQRARSGSSAQRRPASSASEEDREALKTLQWMIGSGEWDVKLLDAIAALRTLEPGVGSARTPARVEADVSWTGIIRGQLLTRQSRREYAPDRWMSDLDVLDAVRLFDDDYPRIHEQALMGLLDDLAAAENQTVDEYVQARLGLGEKDPLPASLATWLSASEIHDLDPAHRLRLVVTRVWPIWHSVDWRPAVLARLRRSDRWAEWTDIVAQADEATEATGHRLVTPPPAMCGQLFRRHWSRGPVISGSSPDLELARRGFGSLAELGRAVGRFFAYDVQRKRALAKAGA